MDFALDEENKALMALAVDFADQKLAPVAALWDETGEFPFAILQEAAALGMGGMMAAPDIGGSHLSRLSAALIFETLATGCVSTAAYLSIHNMVTNLIDKYADVALRTKWGHSLTSMKAFGAYCLTEPESGSDAASLKTKAVREGDYYSVTGAKAFISMGSRADIYLVMVRTGDESYHGISCLLIEKNTPGLSFGKLEKKLGWRNQPTCMLYFDNCKIPHTQLIGAEGDGFKIALNALNGGRINIAACALGGAKTCLRLSQQYLKERKQFGKNLAKFQALRFYFADMLTQLESARFMVYKGAESLDKQDRHAPLHCAMAKRYATDAAFSIADKAMQLLGGYGYLQDYQIERFFRDLRAHQILEGSNEIMREIIAKAVLDEEYLIE